jgi:subtilisin family serine protease
MEDQALPEGRHMRRRYLTALAGSALLMAALLPGAASAASPKVQSGPQPFTKAGLYIVQLRELPTIAYDGKTAGYAATKPAVGKKLDITAAAVTSYVSHLVSRHDVKLAAVGGTKIYDYTISYNGFAARLSATQANKLARDKDVESIVPNVIRTVNTSSTPAFLGLSAPGGLWSQLGGVGHAGEDILIGDVDSGIWPESLSFADRVDANGNWTSAPTARKVYQNLPGANVKCQVGEAWTATTCNQKLIGARYYNAAFGGNAGINATRPWEFNSARDYNGHGTHTASTAGGNFGVKTTGPAAAFGNISGMAPRARIAAYKALWSTQDASTASGGTIDLVAAIDQAVADGVDVINYSISGTSTDFLDPVEVSYLFAAQAGIFVSESAGNSGPAVSTVAHPSPWTTTVAAGTHDRAINGSVTLGNGATYFGASIATAVGPKPVILSSNAAVTGAVADEARLCFSAGSAGHPTPLDPAKVAGKIVVCDRGVNARTDKSLAVKNAGGVGMILVNTSPNSLNADFHVVPTVHLSDTDGVLVKAYVTGTASPTATINAAAFGTTPAPFTAAFSSRGPLLAGGGDLLKPDVIAPGVDILASVAPPGNSGLDFNLYSGTSMSAPHVTGVAALLKDLHPSWSPMAIKSALMTSAGDVLDGPNTDPLTVFKQGAGHIQPNTAAHPGLVFNSAFDDWRGFLRGQGLCTFCGGTTPAVAIDASNFNVASIAIGDLAGTQTVTRKVTNVGSTAATYTPSVTGLAAAGITAVVSPSSFTINPGETKSFTVAFTRTTAAFGAYAGGQLTWTGGGHAVRIPIVIKPVALAAPVQVNGTGGPISYNVKFGYTGPFTATGRGLVPAQTFSGSVSTDPDGVFHPVAGPDVASFTVTIPAGTTYTRIALFSNATTAADLDLYVYSGTTQVAASAGGTADEEVDFLNPAAATYTVWVHGYDTANPSPFTLFAWSLGSTSAGNMAVSAPASATLGETGAINLTFSGLTAGTRYLGSVAYGGEVGLPNPTIVRVDTP